MTGEEAISHIRDILAENNSIKPSMVVFELEKEALRVAIKALEQEPCEDVISRQAVLDTMSELNAISFYEAQEDSNECYHELRKAMEQLPSVTPQQKTGHWYIDERPESNREVTCSNCDQPIFKYHRLDFDYRPKYCPNCGARMEKNEKDKIRQGCYRNR